jgi:hypothetical protein
MTYFTSLKTIHLLLALALAATQLVSHQSKAQSQQEQTSFCETGASAKDELKPVPIPPEVLAAVMDSELGKQAQADAKKRQVDVDPAKLLKGTPIQLSNSRGRSFILMGDTPPLTGADNTWFWIVQESEHGAATLLWVGANCVEIKPRRTLGYRDVEAYWSSAAETRVETYQFDGNSYKLRRSRSVQR